METWKPGEYYFETEDITTWSLMRMIQQEGEISFINESVGLKCPDILTILTRRKAEYMYTNVCKWLDVEHGFVEIVF